MNALLAEHLATPKFRAWLLSLFAIVALCPAMAGIYGVMAYVAAQRSKEIGVRMALGATAGAVLWVMFGRGLKQLEFVAMPAPRAEPASRPCLSIGGTTSSPQRSSATAAA